MSNQINIDDGIDALAYLSLTYEVSDEDLNMTFELMSPHYIHGAKLDEITKQVKERSAHLRGFRENTLGIRPVNLNDDDPVRTREQAEELFKTKKQLSGEAEETPVDVSKIPF